MHLVGTMPVSHLLSLGYRYNCPEKGSLFNFPSSLWCWTHLYTLPLRQLSFNLFYYFTKSQVSFQFSCFLKHLSLAAFQITRGFSIFPTKFWHNNTVNPSSVKNKFCKQVSFVLLSLGILHPTHFSPLTARDFVGKGRKNNLFHLHCKCF